MIEICSLRNEKICNEWDVRVDRASVLGNPFRMRSESERDMVCEKYKEYFKKKILEKDERFLEELRRLYRIYKKYGKLRLFCWCAPRRCHAETIKEFLEMYVK